MSKRQWIIGVVVGAVLLEAGYLGSPVLAASRLAAGANTGESPAKIDELLHRWAQQNEACRGGPEDSPSTNKACEARTVTDGQLKRAGWCYGENAAFGYQYEWRPCGRPRFTSREEAERSAQTERGESRP